MDSDDASQQPSNAAASSASANLPFDDRLKECATNLFHDCLEHFSDTILNAVESPLVGELEREKWIISTTAPRLVGNECDFLVRFGAAGSDGNPPLNYDRYSHAFFFGVLANVTGNPTKIGFRISHRYKPEWRGATCVAESDRDTWLELLDAVVLHMDRTFTYMSEKAWSWKEEETMPSA